MHFELVIGTFVPISVSPPTPSSSSSWSSCRLHKLQQKEDQRQQLAARAKQLTQDEEHLSWDDDDDVDENNASNGRNDAHAHVSPVMGPSATAVPAAVGGSADATATPQSETNTILTDTGKGLESGQAAVSAVSSEPTHHATAAGPVPSSSSSQIAASRALLEETAGPKLSGQEAGNGLSHSNLTTASNSNAPAARPANNSGSILADELQSTQGAAPASTSTADSGPAGGGSSSINSNAQRPAAGPDGGDSGSSSSKKATDINSNTEAGGAVDQSSSSTTNTADDVTGAKAAALGMADGVNSLSQHEPVVECRPTSTTVSGSVNATATAASVSPSASSSIAPPALMTSPPSHTPAAGPVKDELTRVTGPVSMLTNAPGVVSGCTSGSTDEGGSTPSTPVKVTDITSSCPQTAGSTDIVSCNSLCRSSQCPVFRSTVKCRRLVYTALAVV